VVIYSILMINGCYIWLPCMLIVAIGSFYGWLPYVVAMCGYHVWLPCVVAKSGCHELYTYLSTFFLAFSPFLLFSSPILPCLPLLSYNYIFPNSHSTLLFYQYQPWEKVLFPLFLSYYFYHLNFFFLHLAIHT